MTERLVTNKGQCVVCMGCIEESNCTVECGAIDDCLEKAGRIRNRRGRRKIIYLSG